MEHATAEVQLGKHHFRLTVQEKWAGIYFVEVFDKDHQMRIGNDEAARIEGTSIKETLDRTKSYAESELRLYVKDVLKQDWPTNLQINWDGSP
jgi:hypothetical protein